MLYKDGVAFCEVIYSLLPKIVQAEVLKKHLLPIRKALNGRGAERLPKPIKLRMPENPNAGVRRREISFVVKRETAQTHS